MDRPPTDQEDEFFRLEELTRLRGKRDKIARETAGNELARLKELHWMRCPKCGMELDEVDFKGVKVDACLTCGGMFFDSGEVDSILEHREPGFLDRMFKTFSRPGDYGST